MIGFFCILIIIIIAIFFLTKHFTIKNNQIAVIQLPGLSLLQKISIDGAIISYRTIGHGPDLLLLPSAQMTLYTWNVKFIQTLAKHYRLILVDYPGINESVMKSGEFTVQGLAEIFSNFISAINLQNFTLVGYSMGGWIAQWIAIHHAERLAKLILIASDAGGSRATPTAMALLTQLMEAVSDEERHQLIGKTLFTDKILPIAIPPLSAVVRVSGNLAKVPSNMLNQEYNLAQAWFAGSGTYKLLSQIAIPTLVITGILDKIVHRQNALVLANSIPGAKLSEYPDAAHGVIFQYPKQVAQEIIQLK